MSGSKYESLSLSVLGGEQSKSDIVIPFESFVIADDKTLFEQIDSDKRKDKFIYAYSDSGISANKRNWSPKVMKSISKQVVSKLPVGYLGHIKPSEYGYEFPEPQVVWIGSCTEDLDDNTTRLWIKGYLLDTAEKLTKWIKAKAVDSISVYGKISYTEKDGIYVIDEVDLKSIDISRKLGEGLKSGIVSIGSEMAETYEELRGGLDKACKPYFTDLIIEETDTINGNKCEVCVYPWVREIMLEGNRAIVSVDGKTYNDKVFEVTYKNDGDEIIITGHKEVKHKVVYEPIDNKNNKKEDASEMEKKSKEEIIKGLTLADIEANNPELLDSIAESIAKKNSNKKEAKKKEAKAMEMDKISQLLGGESEDCTDVFEKVDSLMKASTGFVGEMSAILLGGESEEVLKPEEVVAKTKELVEDKSKLENTVKTVSEKLGVKENSTLEEAAEAIASERVLVANKEAIAEVTSVFDELCKGVDDETIIDFIKDDLSDIIDIKPDEIDDEDWKENTINYLNNNFPKLVEKYKSRVKKIYEKAKAVGEMNGFIDYGNNLGGEQSENNEEDPDIAEAKRLGYM